MKISKVQNLTNNQTINKITKNIGEKSSIKSKITPRKLPNSISDAKEVFNSTCEYSEKYIEILEKMPDWIKKIIKS